MMFLLSAGLRSRLKHNRLIQTIYYSFISLCEIKNDWNSKQNWDQNWKHKAIMVFIVIIVFIVLMVFQINSNKSILELNWYPRNASHRWREAIREAIVCRNNWTIHTTLSNTWFPPNAYAAPNVWAVPMRSYITDPTPTTDFAVTFLCSPVKKTAVQWRSDIATNTNTNTNTDHWLVISAHCWSALRL